VIPDNTLNTHWSHHHPFHSHHVCLMSNGHQNPRVAEDEGQEYNNIERHELPDPVGRARLLAFPE